MSVWAFHLGNLATFWKGCITGKTKCALRHAEICALKSEVKTPCNLEYRTIRFFYRSENLFCFVLQIGCIPTDVQGVYWQGSSKLEVFRESIHTGQCRALSTHNLRRKQNVLIGWSRLNITTQFFKQQQQQQQQQQQKQNNDTPDSPRAFIRLLSWEKLQNNILTEQHKNKHR